MDFLNQIKRLLFAVTLETSQAHQLGSQPEVYLQIARRTTEPHHANATPQTDALDKRFLKEVGELESGIGSVFRLVQLLSHSQNAEVMPTMEGGITDHVWTIEELLI